MNFLKLVLLIGVLVLVLAPPAMVFANEASPVVLVDVLQEGGEEVVATPSGDTVVIRVLEDQGLLDSPWAAVVVVIVFVSVVALLWKFSDAIQNSIPAHLYEAGKATFFDTSYAIAKRTPGDMDDKLIEQWAAENGYNLVKKPPEAVDEYDLAG